MPVDNEEIATRVVYELLGRRWVWPAVSTTEVFPMPAVERRIFLSGRPIISVDRLLVGDTEVTDFRIENKAAVRLPNTCPGWFWSSTGWIWTGYGPISDVLLRGESCKEVRVEYTYGSPPPEGVAKAITTLACELDKAYSGDEECRLPERVQSISRQGIDIAFLDPQDFLDQGRTGLLEVDLMLSVYNSAKAKRRARVYSADSPPGRRLQSGS